MAARKNGLTRREFFKITGKIGLGATIGTGTLIEFAGRGHAAKNSMIFGMNQEPVQFNPLLYVNMGPENIPEACVFDALWDVNEKGEFTPNLAVRVPNTENGGISPDGTIWKIELKKGVKWHDGHPFTAKDVEFTAKTIMNPKVSARSRSGFDLIKELKVLDDYHIEIILSKPYVPYFWSWQNMHIIPEHILSNVPDINTAPFNTRPVGTGPFLFNERSAGSHIVFKKNPKYHGKISSLETFICKYVPDQTVLYTQFKTGEIDVLGIQGVPPERYEEAKGLSGKEIILTPTPTVEFIYFNCEKPQFKDPRVRRALYIAADKEKWIKDVYYGTVPRTLSYLSPTHWAYNKDLKDPAHNPREASQLLDAAGWKVGSDGIREKDGIKLKFTMSTTAGSKAREQAQALVQQNWKDVNVAMEIKNFPASVVWGEYTTMSKFDTLMVGWQLPVGVDPDYTARCHSKQIPAKYGSGANYVQYENPAVDKLLEEGVVTQDRNKRREIYGRLQRILHDEVPFAPIFSKPFIYGKKSDIKGYKMNIYNIDQTWNVQDWYWG
jgi:peptide/nickel transport system substrate-binding protein